MDRRDYLKNIYKRNPDTGKYIIEVTVKKYGEIFNDLDSAPFVKRDLNPEVREFINNCSTDIPFKYGIDICFYILNEAKSEKLEKMVISGLKTYFAFYIHLNRGYLKKSYGRIAEYMGISFTFLLVSFLIESKLENSILCSILLEGLTIGGWVFLWEAITFLLNRFRDIRDEVKALGRFLHSKIYFKYD